ncbi:hypothetical protein BG006_010192 [Podila minutissima]|uniref:Transmembrane protein n=1 Tax=Podila minutissima TaxID=64525 RepID=A0A9P5SDD7_9FUNG|nr:hypothetical protein BG006_010192 [Podila minutissima]
MLPSHRLLSLAASVALILPMVQAQSSTTSAVQPPTSVEPPTSTSTTTTTTAVPTIPSTPSTTTVPTIPTIPSTTTVPTIPTIPSTTTVPTIPTIPTSSSIRTTAVTVPRYTTTTTSTTLTSTTTLLLPTQGSSSSSSNNNIPVIVGSIAGVAALAIILITSISCYRRRRRANRELTFDALGLGNTGGGKRNTIPFSSNKPSGAIGLNSVTSGGYDDDEYGYDMQQQGSGNGYPSPHQPYNNSHQHQQQFNNGFDVYGQGVHPTIFNEDHHHGGGGAYATASSMSRNRMGFDQNLPEVMYRNGEEDQVAAAATGYYDDTGYDVAWNQQLDPSAQYGHGQGGYVNGLWVANPEGQYYEQEQYQDQYQQQQHQQEFYDEPLDPLAPSRPVITSAQSKDGDATNRHSFNPQAILPATSAVGGSEGEGSQLRSHDLFVQTSEAPPAVTSRKSQSPPASPSSRLREMRSMELARQSPTSRPSGEGGRTYADDVQGSGSPPAPVGAKLNGQKSLRSARREDWS